MDVVGAPPARSRAARPAGAGPPRSARVGRLAGLGAAVAATATVAFTDPERASIFPPCPSRVLLGLDCPACGGLRGTHDLLNGRIGEALGHNLLLPGWLLVIGVMLALWLLPLIGRPTPPVHVPRWLWVTAGALTVAFTVARNLPIDALRFLASGA